MRKFDCTQPSRPAGIATGDEFRPIQDRSPMTAKSCGVKKVDSAGDGSTGDRGGAGSDCASC
jgi:hypothetical protein